MVGGDLGGRHLPLPLPDDRVLGEPRVGPRGRVDALADLGLDGFRAEVRMPVRGQ